MGKEVVVVVALETRLLDDESRGERGEINGLLEAFWSGVPSGYV